MKLREILENIHHLEKDKWFNVDELCSSEFEIHQFIDIPDDFKLSTVRISKALCTDTYVGHEVLYFVGRPVCLIHQSYRKSSKEYDWFSDADFRLVREYILSLTYAENLYFTIIDLDEEMGDGVTGYEFSSYVLQDEVIHNPSGNLVKVLNKKPLNKDYELDEELLVEFSDGRQEIIPMLDVTLPWLIKK